MAQMLFVNKNSIFDIIEGSGWINNLQLPEMPNSFLHEIWYVGVVGIDIRQAIFFHMGVNRCAPYFGLSKGNLYKPKLAKNVCFF